MEGAISLASRASAPGPMIFEGDFVSSAIDVLMLTLEAVHHWVGHNCASLSS